MSSISDALATSDLPALIQLIKDDSTWDIILRLCDALHRLSFANPSRIDVYTAVLASLRLSEDVPDITVQTDDRTSLETFESAFAEQIHTVITDLYVDGKHTDIEATNVYLLASILSGSAIRRGLCVSSQQVSEVMLGLQFQESMCKEYAKSTEYEVNAVGACIHVLAAGRAIVDTNQLFEAELEERINSIGSVAKCDASTRIFKAAQRQVANNFKKPLSSQEILDLLEGRGDEA